MKKITLILLFSSFSLWAQSKVDLQEELNKQKTQIKELKTQLKIQENVIFQKGKDIAKLRESLSEQTQQLENLKALTESQQTQLKELAASLGAKIETHHSQANAGIQNLNQSLSKQGLYWSLGAVGFLLLVGGIGFFLSKRIKHNQTDIEEQLKRTKKSLEEEAIKLDSKLVEVLESQLKLHQAETPAPVVASTDTATPDHSLALKVADEIVRMQKNIAKMPEDVKGLKPLLKGIERIQNNFLANGYEMINLLNKDYDERMNIDVINFITDENIPSGRKVITAVIKPQVNYNGVLIQRAQVDVSQN
ncbi:hypothetical protein [Capnocytophaga granulosa]|uniref:hypothetical protein n=1 Tax=Capnocytophaga granulosa TaxID=45242 RepID=UPI0023F41575|nr:hypothetical protein [Capnocytophaga granulosa]